MRQGQGDTDPADVADSGGSLLARRESDLATSRELNLDDDGAAARVSLAGRPFCFSRHIAEARTVRAPGIPERAELRGIHHRGTETRSTTETRANQGTPPGHEGHEGSRRSRRPRRGRSVFLGNEEITDAFLLNGTRRVRGHFPGRQSFQSHCCTAPERAAVLRDLRVPLCSFVLSVVSRRPAVLRALRALRVSVVKSP